MKLDTLTLDNFRQYFGKQTIKFARDDKQSVTVIQGHNGAGKTSLFTAINWCLYAEGAPSDVELISKEAISRARSGDMVQAAVSLTFYHEGERYLVRRSVRAQKGDGAQEVEVRPSDEFIMQRIKRDGQAGRIDNPIGTINSILPANVRTYFLFDGEKIDNFAKPEAKDEVKAAIYLVLKLEILDRACRHLSVAASDYRKELKRVSSGSLLTLVQKDEKVRADLARDEARKEELTSEIESARKKIIDIDGRLREMQNAAALQAQRDRAERDLKDRTAEIDAIRQRVRDLAGGAHFAVAGDVVSQALGILEAKRQRGEIPSSIRQQFVRDLLAEMTCICGRPISEGSPEYGKLTQLLERSVPGSLEDDVLDTAGHLGGFSERTAVLQADLAASMSRRAAVVDIIDQLTAELDDVGRQLKSSPLEEVSRLQKQRESFLGDIDQNNLEIGEITGRLTKLSKDIKDLGDEIARAEKEERREKLLTTKLELAQHSADAIEEMRKVFADDMRAKIEAKTKEIFKRLIWKDSHFDDVKLGSDFNLEVIDRYGTPARPDLSAGERQVLSLSFITAMSRVSEEEAPLVMDTPFGRLSSEHRNAISTNLPELACQLVLLVTDEELHGKARENVEARIGNEYRLEFNRLTSTTSIVEVA